VGVTCPVLGLVTVTPLAAAVLIMLIGRTRPLGVRVIAVAAAALTLVLSLYIYLTYDVVAGGFQFRELYPLVPALGISVELGADGMSVLMILLTAIIIFCRRVRVVDGAGPRPGVLRAPADAGDRGVRRLRLARPLRLLPLLRDRGVADVPPHRHLGLDGRGPPQGLFGWAFRETGVGTKEYAAMKLTLYLLLGSAFILGRALRPVLRRRCPLVLAAGALGGDVHADDPAWVFLALYVGFGILAGIWPLHTWSPDGHASAPTAVSMLHAGVLMKLGAYGVVRVAMTLLPEGTQYWAPLVGDDRRDQRRVRRLSAMAQTDLKYVIAYSSVSHMGLVMLGAATLTRAGLNGSVFQMFAHGDHDRPLLRPGGAHLREVPHAARSA
jgi:NADH-quinone oxidoreductase subunit M